ncbi:MAG TPA: sigma-70 family RNA polymerase sigma factor [Pirellulales bacterium]|jgi:RNA polymerase sigma-70 factor (ECF subfamily)|nr:sigma-70 family RNA polymerase sigma factor [Pirellulales bacterium]
MTNFPETRASLILRIANRGDAQAWDEFVRVYQPAIYHLACRQGFQHADAEELAQEAMLAVARAVERWAPDPQRGRFRNWLFRIARNLSVNFRSRRKHQVWGTGNSGMQSLFDEQCNRKEALSQFFELEYQRAVFQCAAKHVQNEVKEKTWQAFWLSTIGDEPMAEVARRLDLSIGAVYIARNRVIARLRIEVRRIEDAAN